MTQFLNMDYLKSYGSIGIAAATIIISLVTQWAIFGVRLASVEERQNRQGTTIQALQSQVTGLANDISGMKEKLNSINDNVNYIRNRIDRAVQ